MSKKPRQKPAQQAFTSFRILGRKAQELIKLAKASGGKREKTESAVRGLPQPAEEPTIQMSLSAASVAKSTLVILGLAVGAWMLFALRDKIMLLLLSIFLAAIIDPGVAMLERKGVPRGIGILLHYLIAVSLFVFLLVSLIPIIADQLQEIARLISAAAEVFFRDPRLSLPLLTPEMNANLSELIHNTLENLSINRLSDALQSLGQSLASFAGGSVLVATRVGLSVLEFFLRFVVVLVLAFFIQIEKENIRAWVRGFFPVEHRRYMDLKTEAVQVKIGRWARGQLLLGLCVGCLVFLALSILGIKYAVTLAVLAAFTEFIPYIGPFIAAVPAVLIALTEGGMIWAAIVAAIYYVVQWCENNLLVPLIMKRAVGLSPIAIIFAMLVGVSFSDIIHPILGILLAVPVATIILLFLEDWRETRMRARETEE
jgi:predicted PurR-regulated permease PerM